MNVLKANFGDPNAGWVDLTLTYRDANYEEQTLEITASYIFDCFLPLTEVLHRVWEQQGESVVTLLAEPEQCELRFTKVGEDITLTIDLFPGHVRKPGLADRLLVVSGTYAQVCLPFWRALRGLQGRFSEQELHERWLLPFPARKLSELTAAIKGE